MKRAFLYVRVSSEEQKQHGISIESQVAALEEYCKKNDYQIVDIYNDAGISAHVNYKKRKELLRLISDTKKINHDSIILFTKLDRWFRSVEDYYAVMSQIPDSVPWKTIWEDYETETSEGRFKVNIMLSIAQAEAERTADRVKAILEHKKNRGDYVGTVTTGYKRVGGKVIKDSDKQEEIEFMFATYARTQSVRRTVDLMAIRGFNVSRSAVQRRIKNHAYCGQKDNAVFEPYITEEQYRINQSYLKDKIKASTRTASEYLFKGMCQCGYCNRNFVSHTTMNKHANGDKVPCKFYVCNGRENIEKHKLNCQISENNLEIYLLDNITKIIDKHNVSVDAESKNEDYEKTIKNLNDRLSRIGMRFELGDISLEEYKEKRNALIEEIKDLELKMGTRTKISIPDNWREMYNQLDIEHKRGFWKSFIYKVVVTNENKEHPDIIFR